MRLSDRRTPGELALAWRDALVGRDAARFGALFAEDGVIRDVEHRIDDLSDVRPLVGRAAIAEQAAEWLASTPEFRYEVRRVLADERSAAVLWRYEVPAAAGRVSLDGVSWLTCRNGEIEEALVLFDSHALLRALGRVGAAPRA